MPIPRNAATTTKFTKKQNTRTYAATYRMSASSTNRIRKEYPASRSPVVSRATSGERPM